MKKRIIISTIVLIMIFLSGCSTFQILDDPVGEPIQNEEEQDNNKEDKKILAPDFTVIDMEGNEIKLSDYKGKVIFLNFWGTWCPPCRGEMPELEKVYKKYLDEDVQILALNVQGIPQEKSMEEVIQWVNDNEYTMPIAFDIDVIVMQQYSVGSFPTTYLIDKEGYIYGYTIGALNEDQMTEVIERALNE